MAKKKTAPVKPRRVFVLLEVNTPANMKRLRALSLWEHAIDGAIGDCVGDTEVLQVHVNVAQRQG